MPGSETVITILDSVRACYEAFVSSRGTPAIPLSRLRCRLHSDRTQTHKTKETLLHSAPDWTSLTRAWPVTWVVPSWFASPVQVMSEFLELLFSYMGIATDRNAPVPDTVKGKVLHNSFPMSLVLVSGPGLWEGLPMHPHPLLLPLVHCAPTTPVLHLC